jgi:LDH2 family malate/lactate/ureidoglycolate dehydrogenase
MEGAIEKLEEKSMQKKILFRADDLKNFMIRYFQRWNVPPQDAAIAADVLLSADMRGIESHGMIRLFTYYGSRLSKGLIDPTSPINVVRETMTTLTLSGENGLGQVVAFKSMQRCIDKARQCGLAITSVRNSNHFGIAGYYAMMALEQDMIGISLTNSQPLVAPTHGRASILGTNPIAVAIPAGEELPFVLDMATSIVPIGKVNVYSKAGKNVPAGWGMDSQGCVTESPDEIMSGGALMPLGGIEIMSGYKGYGLSLLVDILSGVLSGASFGSEVGKVRQDKQANVGHFFLALRLDAIRPPEEFKRDMDALIRELKTSPKAAGENRIFIHGEKEFERAWKHQAEGVPLMASTVQSLQQAGREAGVEFDLQPVGEETDQEEG